MASTLVKALLFTTGSVAVIAGAAYVSGAFDTAPPTEIAALAPDQSQRAASDAADAPESGTGARLPSAPAPADSAMKPAAPAENAMKPVAPADNAMRPGAPAGNAMKSAAPAENAMKPAAPADNAMKPATPAPAATAEVIAPTFDVVRVEGDGSIVVAGHAAPNATVEIVNGSTVLGSAVADGDGAFAVVLDDPLKPGDYTIVLRSTAPGNIVAASQQTAVVSVPEKPDGQVLAMVEEPGKPSELLTMPKPAAKPEAPAASGEAAPVVTAPPATAAPSPAKPAAPATAETQPVPAAPVTPAAPAASAPKVVVEAVEIDGRKIFVAGIAEAGRKVRAYANDMLLGDATTSPDGHFLVEAERDLPVGNYTMRVDVLGDDGSKVVARAAVPFEREPGEALAAIAPQAPSQPAEAAPQAPAQQPTLAKPAEPAPEIAATEPPAATPPSAPETGEAATPPASGETATAPATGEAAPAPSKPAPTPSAPAAASSGTGAESSRQPAAPAAETPPAATKPPAVAAAPAPAETPAAPVPAEKPAPAAPAGSSEMAAAAPPAGVPETVAPKLEHADGAVIIRRGDSLWRISRRVYGHGTRYSTIYLANQDQIRDPDRIWPGQVFKVPEKSKEGEPADMKAIGEQATTAPSTAAQ